MNNGLQDHRREEEKREKQSPPRSSLLLTQSVGLFTMGHGDRVDEEAKHGEDAGIRKVTEEAAIAAAHIYFSLFEQNNLSNVHHIAMAAALKLL